MKFPQPDYTFWGKAETWSLNKAAFLLHDIDPNQVGAVRLGETDIPPHFEHVKDTYALLRGVPWQAYYSNFYFPKHGVHPAAIIYQAHRKNIPIPDALYKLISALPEYQQLEKENVAVEAKTIIKEKPSNNKFELTTRERRNFLKTIALLVRLHFDEKNTSPLYSRGNKLNASQIAQTLLEKAQALDIETEGLKSLDRKITEALELLAEEIKD